MAAYVSPSPAALASGLSHSRRALRTTTRPATQRAQAVPTPATMEQKSRFDQSLAGDSSDDEDLAPIKLSAEAQAILGEDNEAQEAGKENIAPQMPPVRLISTSNSRRQSRGSPPEMHKSTSPPRERDGSPAPRIVRVTSTSRPGAP